jgi:hypothetical protein
MPKKPAKSPTTIQIHPSGEIPHYFETLERLARKTPGEAAPVASGDTSTAPLYHVGRQTEMAWLADHMQKRIGVLLLGPRGIGKSHLLDNLKGKKIIRIDESDGMRQSLLEGIMQLYGADKEKVLALLRENHEVLSRVSIKRLTDLLIRATDKNEYTIIVDDASRLSVVTVKVFERLSLHFHMIVAARQIATRYAGWTGSFDKLELPPLSHAETLELIRQATDFWDRIENHDLYRHHIWNQTSGNPLHVLEMIDRMRKEPQVPERRVHEFQHSIALHPYDMTPLVLIGLGCFVILRYVGREIGEDEGAYRLFGGIAIVTLIVGRPLLRALQHKYI